MIYPPITPFQVRMCRGGLQWGIRELARQASVAPNTVMSLEHGNKVEWATLETIRRTFEREGYTFLDPLTVKAPAGTNTVNVGQAGRQKGSRWPKRQEASEG